MQEIVQYFSNKKSGQFFCYNFETDNLIIIQKVKLDYSEGWNLSIGEDNEFVEHFHKYTRIDKDMFDAQILSINQNLNDR